MLTTHPLPKLSTLTISAVACRMLLLFILVAGESCLATAFVIKTPSRQGKNCAKCNALSRQHAPECRTRIILEVSNDPNFEKQEEGNSNLVNDTSRPGSLDTDDDSNWIDGLFSHPIFQQKALTSPNPPPLRIEDTDLLFFDVFLLLNLTLGVSFWVVHRLNFDYLSSALGEGSLLCILWIISGLYHGSFLYSAVDGHFRPGDKMSGPKAACILGLHTFISTINLRLVVALAFAFLEHRPVGASPSELLVPLEAGFGLVLMSVWRFLHSAFTPRI